MPNPVPDKQKITATENKRHMSHHSIFSHKSNTKPPNRKMLAKALPLLQAPTPKLSHSLSLLRSVTTHHQLSLLKLSSLTLVHCYSSNSLQSITSQSNQFISLFQRYGFSDEDIERILDRHPRLINSREKTLKPKLDGFLSFGFSPSELVMLISYDPILLNFSIKKRLLHNLTLLEALLGSKELVKKTVARSSRILKFRFEKYIKPNVDLLNSHGIPQNRIEQVMSNYPQVMADKPSDVDRVVRELKKLGLNPNSRAFVVGLNAKLVLNQELWDRKVNLYKSFGWSDEDFNSAFRKHPQCMMTSEWKIPKMMDFFVNKLKWDPVFLSQQPIFVDLSLEKRVVPRCAVLNFLAEKNLLGGESALYRLLLIHEKEFEALFVVKYKENFAEIVELYEGGLNGDFAALTSWQEREKQKSIRVMKDR